VSVALVDVAVDLSSCSTFYRTAATLKWPSVAFAVMAKEGINKSSLAIQAEIKDAAHL
jgi:hypothetical protein